MSLFKTPLEKARDAKALLEKLGYRMISPSRLRAWASTPDKLKYIIAFALWEEMGLGYDITIIDGVMNPTRVNEPHEFFITIRTRVMWSDRKSMYKEYAFHIRTASLCYAHVFEATQKDFQNASMKEYEINN